MENLIALFGMVNLNLVPRPCEVSILTLPNQASRTKSDHLASGDLSIQSHVEAMFLNLASPFLALYFYLAKLSLSSTFLDIQAFALSDVEMCPWASVPCFARTLRVGINLPMIPRALIANLSHLSQVVCRTEH